MLSAQSATADTITSDLFQYKYEINMVIFQKSTQYKVLVGYLCRENKMDKSFVSHFCNVCLGDHLQLGARSLGLLSYMDCFIPFQP